MAKIVCGFGNEESTGISKEAIMRVVERMRNPPLYEEFVQMSEERLYFFIKNFPDRVYCENGRVYIGGLLGYRYFSHKAGDPVYYTEEDYERIKNGGYE